MLGMTESGSVITISEDESDQPEHRRGSFGRPAPGFDTKVIDPDTGEGDWPDGLVDHIGAFGDHLVVVELWESQAKQAAFMESRLGPALGKAGLPEPSRAEWLSVKGHHHDH